MRRIVLQAANEAQVRPACDLLAAHGIAFRVNGAPLSSLRGALPFADAAVTVEVVRDEDLETARRLLAASAEAAAAQVDWRCSGCAEEIPGSFDVCWKCGRGRPAGAAAASTSPYRGDQPAPPGPSAPPAAQERTRATRWRDLGWALAGCVPVALTGLWFGSDSSFFAGWPYGRRTEVLNLVVAAELLIALALFRRRGLRPGDAWGKEQRWVVDLLSALLLTALLVLSGQATYHFFRDLVGPPSSPAGTKPPAMMGLEFGLLTTGLTLAAATGSVWLYGAVLPSARAALGSRVAAFVITSLAGTLMWAPTLYLPLALSVLFSQLLLCGAYLVGGRAWPLALASAASHIVRWIIVTRSG